MIPAFDPEELLGHRAWMQRLARSLVADDAQAEDVVQSTLAAAIEKPWRTPAAGAAWLSRVVRNLAFKARRYESRRRRREIAAARPERCDADAAAIVERAELQREVVEAVLALEEPYRSTVLRRYFEDQSPGAIAASCRIPEATVRTRLRRALSALRGRLDERHGGDRGAWCALLLPAAGLEELSSGASGAAGTGLSSAGAQAGVSFSGITLGGAFMAQKTLLVAGVAGLAALAIGFGIGKSRVPAAIEERVAAGDFVARKDVESLRRELEDTRGLLANAEAERDAAGRRSRDLEGRVAQLDQALKSSEAKLAAEPRPAAARKLPLAFGKWSGLDGFQNADWNSMAEAIEAMNALWLELKDKDAEGGIDPQEFQQRLSKENAKLLGFAGSLISKIPTHSPVNGEFTHPLALSNLMAKMLERGGLPLSEEQRRAVEELGASYDTEYDAVQSGYDESTPRLTKILDEIELKREVMRDIKGVLSPEQREAAFHAEIQDRYSQDVLSPLVSALMIAQPSKERSFEAFQTSYPSKLHATLKLDAAQQAAMAPAWEKYFQELEPYFREPIDAFLGLGLDHTIAAGRAYNELVGRALALEGVSSEVKTALRNSPSWPVPFREKAD
jgi:RNA polymerase sigma-70 factor (ECF subfamily)